jgi:hypothetical protein
MTGFQAISTDPVNNLQLPYEPAGIKIYQDSKSLLFDFDPGHLLPGLAGALFFKGVDARVQQRPDAFHKFEFRLGHVLKKLGFFSESLLQVLEKSSHGATRGFLFTLFLGHDHLL